MKLRYADMPIFLEVAQVIAGYQLQSALSGSFTLGNFTSSFIDRLAATGEIGLILAHAAAAHEFEREL